MGTEKKFQTVVSLVMILATASLGWIGLRHKAELGRIGESRMSAEVPVDRQDVVARLWEDPLQAVALAAPIHEKLHGGDCTPGHHADGHHSVKAFVDSIEEKKNENKKIAVLLVPILETHYPSELENRLRMRYSIQMALAQEDYAPDNREHIGFVKYPVPEQPSTGSATTNNGPEDGGAYRVESQALIPYEWFVPRKPKLDSGRSEGAAVLVVWLPESLLGKAPIGFLAGLRRKLVPREAVPDEHLAGLFVIGPRNSDSLQTLVKNTEEIPATDRETLKDKLVFLSPQATTSDALLGLNPTEKWADARKDLSNKLAEKFKKQDESACLPWSYFENFIVPDDQLTDLIVSELDLRGVPLKDPGNKILLLVEADTAYGRALPATLGASLDKFLEAEVSRGGSWYEMGGKTKTATHIGKNRADNSQLLIHRYLCGLDQQKGQQSAEKQTSRQGPKSAEDALTEALTKRRAMAVGESQLDYVDRLVENIEHGKDNGKIKAVGFLGGDIYDKMILMRSLRSRFPNAIFFTTDLDARLWHPDHLPFSRNTIVASSYAVSAPDSIGSTQSTIPPFREVYQVAVFKATRAAVRRATGRATGCEEPGSPPMVPHIFEIGRDGPIELKSSLTAPDNETTVAIVGKVMSELTAFVTIKRWGGLILIICAIAGGPWCGQRTRMWHAKSRDGWWRDATLASLAVVGIFTFIAYVMSKAHGGEHWSVGDGTSAWPTEIMRLIVICLICVTFMHAFKEYHKTSAKLVKKYHFSDKRSKDAQADGQSRSTVDDLFQEYLEKGAQIPRGIRISVAVLAYQCFAYGVTLFIDGELASKPNIRGDIARTTDLGLLFLSNTLFLALVFYTLDVVLVSSQLLRRMQEDKQGVTNDNRWPVQRMKESCQENDCNVGENNAYLDVQLAAELSQATNKLVYMPFVIQIMLIMAMNKHFDNWRWSVALMIICACNVIMAGASWMIMRRAARKIKEASVKYLDQAVNDARQSLAKVTALKLESAETVWEYRMRVSNLQNVQRRIMSERRGAYSDFFQDPALIALLLPSGVYGIVTILFQSLFLDG